jgi:hypothetical protein
MDARMAMMAMTTNSSMSVKAWRTDLWEAYRFIMIGLYGSYSSVPNSATALWEAIWPWLKAEGRREGKVRGKMYETWISVVRCG